MKGSALENWLVMYAKVSTISFYSATSLTGPLGKELMNQYITWEQTNNTEEYEQ